MAESKSFDLVVIGAGPGGYVAAIRAAQLNLKTAIIERDKLGGVCLNWGCIPSKALLTNARIYNHMKEASAWGISVKELSFDIEHIINRSRVVADTISKGVTYLMRKNKIEVVEGSAHFVTSSELEVVDADGESKERIKAKHVIIATGARARSIPGIEVDGERIITSRHALEMAKVPESIVIIGGGAIGCEFAYFYNSFGSHVTIVEMMDQLLPPEDASIGKELGRSFKKQKIRSLTNTKVAGVKKIENGVLVSVEDKDGARQDLEAEIALNAVGVMGNVENLDLEEIGVEFASGQIKVNQWYETNVRGVYAIGDVIGPPWLAHVASHEAIVCAEKIAGRKPNPVDYSSIPSCTYCQPQVASVGLTEARAREEGYEVKLGEFPFRALGKARASQATDGFVKLIFDAKYGELLGAHIIGEEATELIAELVTAKSLETTYLEILRSVHAHPTLSEAVMEAAGAAYGEQIHL
jgi:dihydrolipoamide dehydrogenase